MVRFGIAGFGLHAVKRLMPGFLASKRCSVTALSRRALSAAQQSAVQYKIPHAFDSVAELSRCSEVDAVYVTTPNSAHLQDVLAAFDAGKHVLCEKPLGMDPAECEQMVAAARKRNLLFGVAHVFRFSESVRILREKVATGLVGRPVFVRSQFTFLAGPAHPRTWIYDAAISGAGPIFDIGVHCIDTLRFILQDEVVRVSCTGTSDARSGNVEASAVMTLEFSKETIGTIPISFRAEYQTPIEIIGEAGILFADNGLNVERPIEVMLKQEGKAVERTTTSNTSAYTRQADAFADAVEGRATFPVPGEEGLINQYVLDAALRSMKSGKAEAVVQPVL